MDELSAKRTCFSQTMRLTGCNMKKQFPRFVPIKAVLLSRHRVSHYDSSLIDRVLLQSSSKTKISTHFRDTNYFKLGDHSICQHLIRFDRVNCFLQKFKGFVKQWVTLTSPYRFRLPKWARNIVSPNILLHFPSFFIFFFFFSPRVG